MLAPFAALAQDSLRLSPPQTPVERLFAGCGNTVPFEFRMKGAVIRYTTNGREPDEQSPVYTTPLPAVTPGFIRAKAFCNGFMPSVSRTVQIIAPGLPVDSIIADTSSPQYRATGNSALHDGRLGGRQLNEHWLGYNKTNFTITIYPGRKKKIRRMGISMLRQQGSWIFLPATVTVYNEKGKPLVVLKTPYPEQPAADETVLLTLNIPAKKYKRLTLKAEAIPALPAWHGGSGNMGWLFVDEVLVW